MKLFRSSNIDIINDCRFYFNFPLPSEIIEKRRESSCVNMNIVIVSYGILVFVDCVVYDCDVYVDSCVL